MENRTAETLLMLALICAVGYLIYLDWLRQGELDFLAEEVITVKRAQEGEKVNGDGKSEA